MKSRSSRAANPAIDCEGPPTVQRAAVLSRSGDVLRPARAALSHWDDPADDSPLRRTPRQVRGYRVEATIERMHRDYPREIGREHVAAAASWLRDFEIGIMGARMSAKFEGRVDGGSPADVPLARLNAVRAYREACAALGKQATALLAAIVIHGQSFAALAVDLHTTPHRAAGRVVAALERLREYYAPTVRRGRKD